ncbi:hypothetical protein B0T26DRAFT_750951 [Lasiosphaeria miniovina]|uniref:Uncharacterized protein n=1 Tax=Lasiosphaeria miniovina TaxID=1954250 RepID=A0AA40AJC6_9PEZI|nr:uncharacterized protein B0T26DRAFT_750951 [Lasiosphaeria miniovina]KAK0716805.1 hypothetical protein B0T26DRAFT_750951 [Lasiosphaeria miniovina]
MSNAAFSSSWVWFLYYQTLVELPLLVPPTFGTNDGEDGMGAVLQMYGLLDRFVAMAVIDLGTHISDTESPDIAVADEEYHVVWRSAVIIPLLMVTKILRPDSSIDIANFKGTSGVSLAQGACSGFDVSYLKRTVVRCDV